MLAIIEREHKVNKKFITAFNTFAELCRSSLNPQISTETINEMLVQHLLTERLFRTVFNDPDFVRRNVIAAEIEKVIDALASRFFNRAEFLRRWIASTSPLKEQLRTSQAGRSGSTS
jgi:predicted helicase